MDLAEARELASYAPPLLDRELKPSVRRQLFACLSPRAGGGLRGGPGAFQRGCEHLRACLRCQTVSILLLAVPSLIWLASQGVSPQGVSPQGVSALLLPIAGGDREEMVDVRVLVTGFEPFGNLTNNPAQLVARHLGEERCKAGACITALHLPVNRTGVQRVASALRHGARARSEYDAVLHLGFESIAKGLRLEIAAANLLAEDHRPPGAPGWSADVPCNTTGTGFTPINAAAPCLLATTAPLDRLDLPLPLGQAHQRPLELWSRDASTFYCNEIFYRTLLAVRERRIQPRSGRAALLPVLFVHLPPLSLSSVETTAEFLWQLIGRIAAPS